MSKVMPITPFPALILQSGSERVLVVSDLHMGWEAALVQKGIHVPSQMPRIMEKMVQLIKTKKPKTLVFLGDVKHTVATAEIEEWRDIPKFFETISEMVQDIRVIPGNHDGNLTPLLPENVKISPSNGVVFFGDIGLFHGHTWPAPELLGCHSLIIGHVHPIVAFRDPLGFRITKQVWVKVECNCKELAKSIFKYLNVKSSKKLSDQLMDRFNVRLRASKLFIMPSFNELLGGQPMNRKGIGKSATSKMFIGPVLRSRGVNIKDAEIYLLDGTFLGSIDQLRKIT